MLLNDIVYVVCLLIGIGVGKFIREVPLEAQRKVLCTAFGVLIVFLVSGLHIIHSLVTIALGSAILKHVHPSKCHIVSFCVIFGYLAFFRLVDVFGLPVPPGHTNMIQMILTLKVVGVAFERSNSSQKLEKRKLQIAEIKDGSYVDSATGGALIEVTDYDVELQSIGFWELFSYCFNYIGVLTGPYYRYRTYRDYFETPFKEYAPAVSTTIEKLKHAGLYCALYLIANYLWPIDYMQTDEFYERRSFAYRFMYIWTTFIVFRMRIYTGLTLSECVCTMAGFGAYPDEANVNNGEGPKLAQYMHLKRDAEKRTYNFTTIVNLRVKEMETSTTLREGMKHWNVCIQYWMATNVYKNFPSKKYRTAATLLCSAFWHGFYAGHYVCLMGAPFYVPIEDLWNKMIRQKATGTTRRIIDVIFWFFAFFQLSYLATAFVLASLNNILRFYSSVYYIGYIVWLILLIFGIILTKLTQEKGKSSRMVESRENIEDNIRPKLA